MIGDVVLGAATPVARCVAVVYVGKQRAVEIEHTFFEHPRLEAGCDRDLIVVGGRGHVGRDARAVRRQAKSAPRQRVVYRVAGLGPGQVEIAEREDIARPAMLVFAAQVAPACDRIGFELAAFDRCPARRGRTRGTVKQVAVGQQQGFAFDFEAGQIGISIESREGLRDAGQLDVAPIAVDDDDFADLRAQGDAAGVVDVSRALVVTGAVIEDPGEMRGQFSRDGEKVFEVIGDFLDRDEFEPAQDFGDDFKIVGAALVYAQVGDIPARDQYRTGLARRRDVTAVGRVGRGRVAVREQARNFGIGVVMMFGIRAGQGAHLGLLR